MLKTWNELNRLDISRYVKKRDNADYLPWSSCLMLLHENGAEDVRFWAETDENGSSLHMSDIVFTDKSGNTNRCYEVIVHLAIDGKEYTMSYPVMNGISPVRDNLMNQNAVHKATMRAFVKCAAINTGLGFSLWMDDSDIEPDAEDLSKHSLRAIKERMQEEYTNLLKRQISTAEIATRLGMTADEVKLTFTYFDKLERFEKGLTAI